MRSLATLFILVSFLSCKNDNTTTDSEKSSSTYYAGPIIYPISHATMILDWNEKTIYVDPVGDSNAFAKAYSKKPDYILITDVHGDHLSVKTLVALGADYTIIAPQAVYDKLPESHQKITKTLANEASLSLEDLKITAVPMYNITPERSKFHTKGRGNGYVLNTNDYNVYISGDTEDIPEMRALKNIDTAFLCMNLPYTMTPQRAADATLAFNPKRVYPYHYRGNKDGQRHYYDINAFEKIVTEGNKNIEVIKLNWYGN